MYYEQRTMNSNRTIVISLLSIIFFCVLLLSGAGCDSVPVTSGPPPKIDKALDVFTYTLYSPTKLDILPLTELVIADQATQTLQINLYVSLLDSFGSQIKSPGVFRFELYEHVQLSIDPKGARLLLWPDIDLTDPPSNNLYWQDFLRAYEFKLDFQANPARTYVLHLTCLCPAGRRLSIDVILRLPK